VSEASPAARVAVALAGGSDLRRFRAPGRVNLMGDHTDYNDGFVLPLAVDRECVVAARPGRTVRVRSLDLEGTLEVPADGSADPPAVRPAWGRYVAGVVRELAVRGRPPVGMEATVASSVPLGSGLSSSAALEVACAVALAAFAEWDTGLEELAQACRAAEEVAVGVPCGIMDQLASLAGRTGAALLVDCRTLAIEPVPIPAHLGVLVVHSGVERRLDASAYADRRRACERIARDLGLAALRDATAEQVADEPLARHVVAENGRVHATARALRSGDAEVLGRLLVESHASLRDDFRVSTPELDVLVAELVDAGAYGARLTGAGFGGCVVAVCDAARVDEVAAQATARYRSRTRCEPRAIPVAAADGAGPLAGP
jgi:galactokinase